MPALNEVDNLRWLLPQIDARFRVIVVDNGSTDETAVVAEELGAKCLYCETKGYGIAVQQGFKWLRQNDHLHDEVGVFIMDADGTSPPAVLDKFCLEYEKNGYGLILGQRSRKLQEDGAMPSHASFGNWLQVFLIGLLTGFHYIDMGPLRLLSGKAIKQLKMEDTTWAWNVEMQVKAAMIPLKVKELEIEYHRRKYGESKISGSFMGSVKAGIKILYGISYYFFKTKKMLRSTSQIVND